MQQSPFEWVLTQAPWQFPFILSPRTFSEAFPSAEPKEIAQDQMAEPLAQVRKGPIRQVTHGSELGVGASGAHLPFSFCLSRDSLRDNGVPIPTQVRVYLHWENLYAFFFCFLKWPSKVTGIVSHCL